MFPEFYILVSPKNYGVKSLKTGNLNLDIEVHYVDSKSANGFIIQAADYISNAIYSFYEYRYDLYYNKIKTKIFAHDLFPREKFGL